MAKAAAEPSDETRAELLAVAQRAGVPYRSRMNEAQPSEALDPS